MVLQKPKLEDPLPRVVYEETDKLPFFRIVLTENWQLACETSTGADAMGNKVWAPILSPSVMEGFTRRETTFPMKEILAELTLFERCLLHCLGFAEPKPEVEESKASKMLLAKPLPRCETCNDTGVIETGNNDLPCHCAAADTAIFNTVRGAMTGRELKDRGGWK